MHAYLREHFVLITLLVTCSVYFAKGCEFTYCRLWQLYVSCPHSNYEIDSYSIFFQTSKVYLFAALKGTRQIYYKQIHDSGLNLSESGLEFNIAYTC